tara:strand:+ start:980 stop:2743 length:1764 start_codon:yes stop_codon:yes gene_type:complete
VEKNNLTTNTKIIAEIANSHQGNSGNAIMLGNKCISAGASAIKFQVYFADELLHNSHKRFNHFKKQSFSSDEWGKIFKNIKKKRDTKIYCDVFGLQSFAVANNSKVDGFKVHSSDLINRNLLDRLCKIKNKDIFLSTGGSTLREIAYAVSVFKKRNIRPILMHGYQSYPTKVEDTNLNRIILFKRIFKDLCYYGYQDHIAGDQEMSSIIPFVSMSLNIKYIEKHVTLNRSKKGVDYYSSIEPHQLKKFIKQIEEVKKSFGSNQFNFSKNERKYRNIVKKIWYSKKNFKSEERLSKKNLIMKRPPSHKIAPGFVENFENIRVINGFNKNISITKSKLKNRVAAVILSRLKSKRLPGKALKIINDESLMTHLIKRVKLAKNVNKIIMATTRNKEDEKICKIAKKNKISFYRGDEKNVLKRMYEATKKLKCDISIRITGDDILIDPFYLDKLIKFHLENNLEYSNNKNLPGGTEVEIFNTNILKFLLDTIDDLSGTEYLTFFIQRYKDQFITGSLNIPKKHQSQQSLTIDTTNDFLFVKKFLKLMSKNKMKYDYTMDDIISYLQKNKKKNPISKKPILINTDLKWEKIII